MVVTLRIMTPCGLVGGLQRFGRTSILDIRGRLEPACSTNFRNVSQREKVLSVTTMVWKKKTDIYDTVFRDEVVPAKSCVVGKKLS
jgi:hypothetical protein